MRWPKARSMGSRSSGGRLRVRSRRWVWARTQPAAGMAAGHEPVQGLGDRAGLGQAGRQDQGVLEGQGGALGHVGGHAVGGVADQGHRPPAPALGGDLLDRGDVDALRLGQPPQQLGDGGGEAGEALAEGGQRVATRRGGGGVGGDVGVAVDQPAADRFDQERGAPAEHGRPGGDLGRGGGQPSPAVLADRHRRLRVDGQPPDRRPQPVGADDQVELGLLAVVEGHLDRPVQTLQRPDGPAHADGHALAQDLVEGGPGQAQAGADVPPQRIQVDLGQQPAVVVEQPLVGDGRGPGRHRLLQAERP